MGRTLYMQCESGISGDMVVGALLDAGASEQGLRDALACLGLEGYEVKITHKTVGALAVCDFDVVLDAEHENHDHDMEWLYGSIDDEGDDGHDHHHHGHHEHGHHEHGHHEHRNLADIRAIVEAGGLPKNVTAMALKVFGIIAEAEAKAHGTTPDEVHFHEVGAVDSIVDVVAAAWCLDDLGVDDVVITELAEGEGHVRCAHGVLPIPVPAVANIVEANGLVLRKAHHEGELVTPTGAAIAAAFRSAEALPESYRIIATGRGSGKRAYNPPSMVYVMLVEDARAGAAVDDAPLWKLETEVDDCTGEALGFVMDRVFEMGALEAHYIPVFMKKGRPGYQIEVLCHEDAIAALESVLFEDTTTIGVRRYPLQRTVLERTASVVHTTYGNVRVKEVTLPDGTQRAYPEHESVAHIARKKDVAYQEVMRAAVGACASCQLNTK